MGYGESTKSYGCNCLILLATCIGKRCAESYGCACDICRIDNNLNVDRRAVVICRTCNADCQRAAICNVLYGRYGIYYISLAYSCSSDEGLKVEYFACVGKSESICAVLVLCEVILAFCINGDGCICRCDREGLCCISAVPVVAFATLDARTNNVVTYCGRNCCCVLGLVFNCELILEDDFAICELLVCCGSIKFLVIFEVCPTADFKICDLFIYAYDGVMYAECGGICIFPLVVIYVFGLDSEYDGVRAYIVFNVICERELACICVRLQYELGNRVVRIVKCIIHKFGSNKSILFDLEGDSLCKILVAFLCRGEYYVVLTGLCRHLFYIICSSFGSKLISYVTLICCALINGCNIVIICPEILRDGRLNCPVVDFLCDCIIDLDLKSCVCLALPLAVSVGDGEDSEVVALIDATDILYCVVVGIFKSGGEMLTCPLDLYVILRFCKLKFTNAEVLCGSSGEVACTFYNENVRNCISVNINCIDCYVISYCVSNVSVACDSYGRNCLSLLFSVIGESCAESYGCAFDALRKNLEGCGSCTLEVACTFNGKSIRYYVTKSIYYVGCFIAAYGICCRKVANLYRGYCLILFFTGVSKSCAESYGCALDASSCNGERFSCFACEVTCTLNGKSISDNCAVCINRVGCFVAAYSVGYILEALKSYGRDSLLLSGAGIDESITESYGCICDALCRDSEGCGCFTCEVACTLYGYGVVTCCGSLITCTAYGVGYVEVAELNRRNDLCLLAAVIGKNCTEVDDCAIDISRINYNVYIYGRAVIVCGISNAYGYNAAIGNVCYTGDRIFNVCLAYSCSADERLKVELCTEVSKSEGISAIIVLSKVRIICCFNSDGCICLLDFVRNRSCEGSVIPLVVKSVIKCELYYVDACILMFSYRIAYAEVGGMSIRLDFGLKFSTVIGHFIGLELGNVYCKFANNYGYLNGLCRVVVS